MEFAAIVIQVVTAYLIAGGVVAVAFLAVGIDRVDPSSRGAYAFRPLLVPGIVLIWPLVLWRWFRLARPAGH